jgi:spore maturation protein SpmA
MLNIIWIAFFLIALLVAIIKTVYGDLDVFSAIVNATFDSAETAFELSIGLTGILCLWMGLMKIGENGGAIQGLSRIVGPFFSKLFPDVPPTHPARGSMILNLAANMLGLDNAATPAGLKAMNELQELNPSKETASNAQIMFLVLNTSGLTLIPISIMTYRKTMGAENPSDVFLPILIATFISTLVGFITVAIYQKINLLNKVILAYLGGFTTIIAGLIYYFNSLPADEMEVQSALLSNIILYGIISLFIIMALTKKVNVYESFIEGAKGGFEIAIKIIPYLVAILVAIAVFKASGAMGYISDGLGWFFSLFFSNTEFVDGIPTAIMKPLSGSGARGMMVAAMEEHGADSFIGRLTSTIQGATDTTFYIIAVYFGAVGITKTRYAIKAGLLADLGGIIAAIVVSYMFFPTQQSSNKITSLECTTQFVQSVRQNESSAATTYLNDQFVLYDLAYDTICFDNNKVDFVKMNLQPSNEIIDVKIQQMADTCLVKIKKADGSYAYEYVMEKDKIKHVKYIGIFQ